MLYFFNSIVVKVFTTIIHSRGVSPNCSQSLLRVHIFFLIQDARTRHFPLQSLWPGTKEQTKLDTWEKMHIFHVSSTFLKERKSVKSVLYMHNSWPARPEEFLRFVLDTQGDEINPHWRPQHLHCPVRHVNFSVYGYLVTFLLNGRIKQMACTILTFLLSLVTWFLTYITWEQAKKNPMKVCVCLMLNLLCIQKNRGLCCWLRICHFKKAWSLTSPQPKIPVQHWIPNEQLEKWPKGSSGKTFSSIKFFFCFIKIKCSKSFF